VIEIITAGIYIPGFIISDSPATKKCLPEAALRLVGVGGAFQSHLWISGDSVPKDKRKFFQK
jgi:hypothetical protein